MQSTILQEGILISYLIILVFLNFSLIMMGYLQLLLLVILNYLLCVRLDLLTLSVDQECFPRYFFL